MRIEPPQSSPGQRYLAVAARLAGTQPSHHFAVSHVTIGAVAGAAGVSRGALYRLWPSQQDFWDDLIDFLDRCPPRAVRDGAGRTSPTGGRRAESFSDIAQQVLLADTRTLLRTATAHAGGNGGVGAALDPHRAVRLSQLGGALERWAATTGRRFTPGVTANDLAAGVTALGTGLPITGRMCAPEDLRFDSPWFDRPPDGPRTLLGVATEALRDRMTEPGEPDIPPARPPADAAADDGPGQSRPPTGRRREYLEIGARLAVTRDGTAAHRVLGHVTLESVARAAGVTRRTVAAVWPDQDAFRLDLFAHLLAADRAAVVAAVRDAAAQHDLSGAAGDTFCAVGARMHRALEDGLGRATFRAYATQLDEPSLAARAIAEHRRLADSCTVQVHRLLALTNRQLRAGVVGRNVAALLFALNDGFATLLRTSPSAIRDDVRLAGSDRAHSTIGVTVGSVLEALSEPLGGSPEINRYVALIS
jgi:AcrR family transcriptional regulator